VLRRKILRLHSYMLSAISHLPSASLNDFTAFWLSPSAISHEIASSCLLAMNVIFFAASRLRYFKAALCWERTSAGGPCLLGSFQVKPRPGLRGYEEVRD